MIRIPDPPSAAVVAAASLTVSLNKSSASSSAAGQANTPSPTSITPAILNSSATTPQDTFSLTQQQQVNTFSNMPGSGKGNTTDPSSVTAAAAAAAKSDLSPEIASSHNMNIVITSLIAGAMAGALAKTAIAPLDRAKINFQINKDIPYSFRAAAEFLRKCLANEGVTALWRGNSATMARIVPYAAIQFTAHEQFKKLLHVDYQGQSTKLRRFWAGAMAGITSQTLTYPLDLARARMAVTERGSGYGSLKQVFSRMWVEEGPRALFRGYWPTLLGVIPYAGTSFFTYDTLKREYTERTAGKKPSGMISLAFGACAGVVGQTSSYPLDIVRRRMQTAAVKSNGGPDPYKTIMITLRKIYKEEGIKNGFFKGLSMNWIKGPIAVGISFSTYELIKETLRDVFGIDVTVIKSEKK